MSDLGEIGRQILIHEKGLRGLQGNLARAGAQHRVASAFADLLSQADPAVVQKLGAAILGLASAPQPLPDDAGAAVWEAGQAKRLVEIASPVEPTEGARHHRISLMREDGREDESYLAPSLGCALAVAELLLRGEEVPKNYFTSLTAPRC